MSLKRAAVLAVLAACLWAVTPAARAQEEAAEEARPAAPARPAQRAPRRGAVARRYRPSANRGSYDPINRYFYRPGGGANQVAITINEPGKAPMTIYVHPPAGQRMPPQYYWSLVHQMRSARAVAARREPAPEAPDAGPQPAALPPAAVAARPGGAARAPVEAQPAAARPKLPAAKPVGGQFPSRLSPMLGGPENVSLLFALGEAKLRLGRFGEALAAFQRCCADEPVNGPARMALAVAMVGVQQSVRAAEQLRLGIEAMPDLSTVRMDPAEAFSVPDRYTAAIQDLAGQGGNADATFMLAFHYFITGDGARAAELLTDAGDDDAAVVLLRDAARERGTRIAEPKAE